MAICNICGNKAGLTRFKTVDGWICAKCFKKCGFTLTTPIMQYDTNRIKELLYQKEHNQAVSDSFVPTKSIGSFIAFDENDKRIKFLNTMQGQKPQYVVVNYADILDCDIIEDSMSKTNGGLANAIAGGLIAGGVGAVVGASTASRTSGKSYVNELKVKLTINNLSSPTAYIQLISFKVKTSSEIYKNANMFANDILSSISVIMAEGRRECDESRQTIDAAEEIRKYKSLLDDCIITEAEFNEKKKQLLRL
ncbi:DUF4428 domain-containing protein [Bacilliculturomica massiliensis]|uniref:DUF4428 domain-containing protein n=1 Tax=Bacilliculturomica massiliensis TaxID=1917867 RepID=UPI00102F333E|nr:DUF4428 domain-containing protein [Bacilliculturomica massiliensis]